MVKVKFFLSHHWWMGQFVIRGQPVSHYDLRFDEGKESHRYFILDKDPIHVQEDINGILKKCEDERWLTFEGIIPPNPEAPEWLKPGNPNKRIVAHVNRIDSGMVNILEDSPTFISFIFYGKALKGYWVVKKTMPEENVWVFEKSKLPQPRNAQNESDRRIPEWKEMKIIEMTKSGEFSRMDIARKLECSKSTVWLYQEHARKLGLL